MTSRLSVVFDSGDPASLARFWANLLDREVVADDRGRLLPGANGQLGLRFATGSGTGPTRRQGPNRMHLHLTSTDPRDQEQSVTSALRLGARHLDVGQLPDEGHIVLADPEGNEFCIIEPGNKFLAGCGHLGELACDGTRAVGRFWSEALAWPLVWDQDEETAIQSPRGGTKVAWGGPPVAPKRGRNRQRLELTGDQGDRCGEVDRLVALGATELGPGPHGEVELADPDGNEFCLT